ncbi:MAG: Rne/Rng family ribonuclease [Candidatus Gastranaerophilales bacterium]|nr:Rne/Rng family ribonuclease [Candidatus Gastranaerophilales bacterium]
MKTTETGQKIVIAERDNIAAVLDNGKVSEFFINRGEILLGDVYLAQVENVLPSIDAAFVDVGSDKMGFLHAQDVIKKGALQDKLAPKEKLIVQVVKEPTGHKGPRVTTEISLPGRFLVLMPNEAGINVSRKISTVKERARLKSIVSLLKPVGVGVIIRTEAESQSEADIQEDLEILLEKWNNIVTSAETVTAPALLYRDQDLLYRVIREACTEDTQEIIVDTAFALNRLQTLLQTWHMNRDIKLTLYKGSEPLIVAMDIHKEIKAALQTKVNMPSGGYLFIQTTEALTVIDVNSGKFVSSATQDETILKTNIEAVHEIARQLRLRNIGGMIIIDFIDMTSRVDKLTMMEELEKALEPDKAKPQVGQLSDLGLVELTRHRQGQALAEVFAKKCPHCQGNGYIMEDIKYASPTAEGEYRAKAAKMKLPLSGFKKNNNQKFGNKTRKENNEPQNDELNETRQEIEISVQVDNPSTVVQEENEILEQNKKSNKNNRRSKFNKNKVKELIKNSEITETSEVVLPQNPEIELEIEPKPVEEKPEEPKPETVETEKTETPKRIRRPNRGQGKTRGRKTAKAVKAVDGE